MCEWCNICKANGDSVIDTPPMRGLLTAPGVVAMRAEWAPGSVDITAYLQSFGRNGIPLDVIYCPGAPNGLPLSAKLTADQVTRALREAAGHTMIGGVQLPK